MRGFLTVKAKNEGMGAAAYAKFESAGKRTDTRTEDARRRFKTPPYYFIDRDRREKDDESNLD